MRLFRFLGPSIHRCVESCIEMSKKVIIIHPAAILSTPQLIICSILLGLSCAVGVFCVGGFLVQLASSLKVEGRWLVPTLEIVQLLAIWIIVPLRFLRHNRNQWYSRWQLALAAFSYGIGFAIPPMLLLILLGGGKS